MSHILVHGILALQLATPAAPTEPAEVSQGELTRITHVLEAGQPPAARWRTGWTIAYGALLAGQVGLALSTDALIDKPSDRRIFRANRWVGAATSVVGFLGVVLLPATATAGRGAEPLSEVADDGEKLAMAERLLEQSAGEQAFGQSWLSHIGVVVINGIGGLVLWLAYDRPWDGLLHFGLGAAIGELQIWTQPTDAIEAWDEHRSRASSLTSQPGDWQFSVAPGGLQVAYHF